jgi:acetate kinase
MTSAGPRSTVLALNSGSSSLKFGLYRVESFVPKMLLSGETIGGREAGSPAVVDNHIGRPPAAL